MLGRVGGQGGQGGQGKCAFAREDECRHVR